MTDLRTVEWGTAQIARAEGVHRDTALQWLRRIRAEHPELVRVDGRRLLIRKSVYEARFARGSTPMVGAAMAKMDGRLSDLLAQVQDSARRIDKLMTDMGQHTREMAEIRRRIEAITSAGLARSPLRV